MTAECRFKFAPTEHVSFAPLPTALYPCDVWELGLYSERDSIVSGCLSLRSSIDHSAVDMHCTAVVAAIYTAGMHAILTLSGYTKTAE